MPVSKSERAFLADGIEHGVRCDGRDRLATRPIQIQIGVLPHASGSALLKCGGTKILVGVKAELMEVDPCYPDCGKIEVSCSTAASPIFDGKWDDISAEVCNAMNKLLCDGIPRNFFENLCVTPGKQCWCLYADATVLEFDGSLLDTVSMAVYSALANTSIPKIKILDDNEIELLDSPEDCSLLDVSQVPVYLSLAQVDRRYVLDATAVEELCSDTRLCVGINLEGHFCASQKREGRGLHPSQLGQMLQACQEMGQQRLKQLATLISLKKNQSEEEQMLDEEIF